MRQFSLAVLAVAVVAIVGILAFMLGRSVPSTPEPTVYVIPTVVRATSTDVVVTRAPTRTPKATSTHTVTPTSTATLVPSLTSTPTITASATIDTTATVVAQRLIELEYIVNWHQLLSAGVNVMQDVVHQYNLVIQDRAWGDNPSWRSSVRSDYDLLVILLDTAKADNPPESLDAIHTATIETLARCAAAPDALGFAADNQSEVALEQSKGFIDSCLDMLDHWSTYLLTLQDN